jgi:hypothetical protein
MTGQSRSPKPAAWGVEELEGRVVPTLLGQQLFPTDYPWNQNISNAPVDPNSAAVIAHIGATVHVHPDWGADSPANGSSPLYGIPHNIVHGNTTAGVNVIIDNYPGESDVAPVPIPANAVIEGDFQNGPNPNGGGYNANQRGDSHLIVWDEDTNTAYELYGVTRPSDPTLFPNTSGVELPHTDGLWHAAQESVWRMNTDGFRSLGATSADAAGLSILAGLARPDEGRPVAQGGQGAINHALRFTLPRGDINPQYVYPASHVVSGTVASNKLPFGARLRLMNTPAVNAVINGLGPQAQIIAHAMQQYGLVLADVGSAMFVTGTSASQDANNAISSTWNMSDVLGLGGLHASDFEVVTLKPTVTGLSASSGPAGSTITITGQNFSGAAGHLKVTFGSAVASSVTFVDDAHITAVVPSGSGTVHVQVQSGVNATDPNNPNDNVNNPIFGYGISATSAADQFTYASAPHVTGVTVNGGAAQRSMVTTLAVTFDTTVTIAAGAFTLTRAGLPNGQPGDGAAVGTVSVTTQTVGGVTVATLSFSGANVTAGSLADGNWTLAVDHTKVLTTAGAVPMAADFTQAGIKRLFGDGNGDGRVDNADFFLLRSTFGLSAGQAGFLAAFDYDGSGLIDNADFFQFRARFGLTI